MIVYFSGTGNSRCCAALLARQLGDKLVDAAPFLRKGAAADLRSEEPWVFVCPTYAWRIPRVFRDFLQRSRFSGSRTAYFVMTCGGEVGDAAAELTELCRTMGMTFRGLFPVKMADNYIVLFPSPKEAEIAQGLENARRTMETAAAVIRAEKDAPAVHSGFADRIKSGPVNRAMYRFYIKPKKFRVTEGCTGCGLCQRRCPLDNIRLREGKPVWSDRCTHCMACVSSCPVSAIEYGKATVGKKRYLCPSCDPAGERDNG